MKPLALVTGGAGFIGSHLVEGLLGRGFAVRVLDDFSSGREANLAAVAERIEIVRGDCARKGDVRKALRDVQVVFHEAALPSVQRSVEDPLTAHRVNVDATLIMLEESRKSGVGRFVFAGSSSAYGNSEELPKLESMRPEPLSPYAAGKLAGEAYCRVFAECYGLHTVVLRYFNVYGPRQDPGSPYSGVISLFVTALLAGRGARIYGDGEQTRDFVYVGDVVAANLLAATADVRRGSVFNVAGGKRISVNRLYRAIQQAVGEGASQLDAQREPARAGDVRDSWASLELSGRELGFKPEVPLEQGIQRTVDHYRGEAAVAARSAGDGGPHRPHSEEDDQ